MDRPGTTGFATGFGGCCGVIAAAGLAFLLIVVVVAVLSLGSGTGGGP